MVLTRNFLQFIVMFRSRFTEAFPKSLINFGPQELERDIVDVVPGEGVEHFLCALLGLLLNRKQDVKYAPISSALEFPPDYMLTCAIRAGHYGRALEEAITAHKSQWPKDWEGKSPLGSGASFASMTPVERVRHTLEFRRYDC